MVKHCNGCHQDLLLTQFHKRGVGGLQARCKSCQRAATYAWREDHPQRARAIQKRGYDHRGRDSQYRRLYGISEAEVDRLLEAQGGRCAICQRPACESRDGRLHVDHDHTSGQIRGLLCHLCNTAIGKLQEDPALLRAAAEYLETDRR